MRIYKEFRPVLQNMRGVSEALVLDVASRPSDTWSVKEEDEKFPTRVWIVSKSYSPDRRYVATVSQDREAPAEIDFFTPIPAVTRGATAEELFRDLCKRFGLVFGLPGGPTLLVNTILHTGQWMKVAGAVAAADMLHGTFMTGHYISKDRYCVDLAFHLDLRSILKTIDAD